MVKNKNDLQSNFYGTAKIAKIQSAKNAKGFLSFVQEIAPARIYCTSLSHIFITSVLKGLCRKHAIDLRGIGVKASYLSHINMRHIGQPGGQNPQQSITWAPQLVTKFEKVTFS